MPSIGLDSSDCEVKAGERVWIAKARGELSHPTECRKNL